jgi:diguanylate cyclase (GGDEF)-like protein
MTPIRHWGLWASARRVIALVLFVDAVALALTVLAAATTPVSGIDVARFLLLAGLTIAYYVATQRLGRARRLLGLSQGAVFVSVDSVWTIAAVVLLPIPLALAVAALGYVLMWIYAHANADTRPRLHRYVYTFGTIVISCFAASAAVRAFGVDGRAAGAGSTVAALAVVIAVYFCVNTGLVASAMGLASGSWRPSDLLGSWVENGLDVATLGLGAVTALSVLYAPWAAVLVLPAVFLLQHQALLRQLVEAATTDVKTDLLNAAAWRQVAEREVRRASQRDGSAAIFVLDMDHFKHINDQHGHLTGDVALKSVAAVLSDELRGYDAVGRFGGEEFVAVLPDTDRAGAEHAAERLRRRIESLAIAVPGDDTPLAVTASIGVALCPEHGASVDDVLSAADDAMYDAKRAGRNSVRMAPAAAWLRIAAS